MPLSVEDAQRPILEFVNHYNMVRLHSAISYITPADRLAGRADAIWAAPRQKLAASTAKRQAKTKEDTWAENRATRGRDPSTGPGTKTEEGGSLPPHELPGLAQKR